MVTFVVTAEQPCQIPVLGEFTAGESKEISVEVPPQYLSIFDEKTNAWQLVPGEYTFMVGGSSQDLPLHQTATHQ